MHVLDCVFFMVVLFCFMRLMSKNCLVSVLLILFWKYDCGFGSWLWNVDYWAKHASYFCSYSVCSQCYVKDFKTFIWEKKNWWLMVSVRCGSVRVPPFDMLKLFMAIQWMVGSFRSVAANSRVLVGTVLGPSRIGWPVFFPSHGRCLNVTAYIPFNTCLGERKNMYMYRICPVIQASKLQRRW